MLIDAHHHLWQYSPEQYGWIEPQMEVLRRDYCLGDLQQVAHAAQVDGFVAVEARPRVEETEVLLAAAEADPLILGVVGWLPLAADDLAAHLERLAPSPWLKGVRHGVQDEPDPDFLLAEPFHRGVALLRHHGLVYDLLIKAHQLPAAIRFADAHPQQPLVLDHLGKPTIASPQFDTRWERDFRELARREHVVCKFSGVVTQIESTIAGEGNHTAWAIDQIRRYWDVALEAFGPQRLLFASDWPVCLLRTSYQRWLETVRELAAPLSASEQAALFGGNAAAVYDLRCPSA